MSPRCLPIACRFPEGILVHDGSVYVGAPNLIFGSCVIPLETMSRTNGLYGLMAVRLKIVETTCTVPIMVPMVFSTGVRGAFAPQQHQLTNGRARTSRAAHIYRALPDGSQLERVITGGMNNPVGLAFNDTGERFLSGTFFDLSAPGRRDGVLHAVYGGGVRPEESTCARTTSCHR